MPNIATPNARATLLRERDPDRTKGHYYWQKIQTNLFVGFRRSPTTGDITWRVRLQLGRKEEAQPLTLPAGTPDKQAFIVAQRLALEWFAAYQTQQDEDQRLQAAQTVDPQAMTLRKALQDYVRELAKKPRTGARASKAADKCFLRIAAPFPDPADPANLWIDKPIAQVTHSEFTTWRAWAAAVPSTSKTAKPGDKRKPQSVNRELVFMRAALNLAALNHGVADQWKKALRRDVKAEKKATPRRGKEVYVSPADRAKLVDAAADVVPAFVPFLKAIMQVPVRPDALASLSVRDFVKAERMIRIGVDKVNGNRDLHLPESAAAPFLEAIGTGKVAKISSAPLFTDARGQRWTNNTWNYAIHKAAAHAGLPRALTMYWLRHTRITDLVNKGVPPMAIAEMAGTSVSIIEDHYFQHSSDMQREALAA